MAGGKKGAEGPITIKKYANRRLYNTATSSYVTLEHLRDMVKEGVEFNVYDAKTNEDITRSVLAPIIFEEEGKSGQNLLPIRFLRQLIQFYGDRMQAFVPSYLELSMESLAKNAETMRQNFAEALGGKMAIPGFEDLARQNVQMFQRAMKMFSPFGRFAGQGARSEDSPAPAADETPPPAKADEEISELKSQIDEMRRQLEILASRAK
ncbi:MAG: polyhydroxyalkanoate synthesis repressor PhaR [Alphaproteobacteria bacterium]|nr:polyhydroxyalkanoate synthesis repressor PhaR [Alphaproteobacteria bacterium]